MIFKSDDHIHAHADKETHTHTNARAHTQMHTHMYVPIYSPYISWGKMYGVCHTLRAFYLSYAESVMQHQLNGLLDELPTV